MEYKKVGEYKVSVIVPVYRVERYINRCMRSLLKQTLKEIEIICICEEEDSSFKRLRYYAQADDRVRVIKKRNTGVSAARNAGIKASRGTYLAFVDADDWIERYALQTLYSVADRYQAQIVAYGIWPTTEPRGNKRGMFGYSPKRNVLYYNNGMKALVYEHGSRPYIGNKFYLRKFIDEHHILFDESIDIGEDHLLQFDAFGKAKTICFIKDKLYHYDIKRNNSAMKICEKNQNVEDKNFKLLQAVMTHKKEQYGDQYNEEYVLWILQYYGWMVNESLGQITENRGKEILAIQKYLNELSAKKYIKNFPKEYQCLYKRFLIYPSLFGGCQAIPVSYKVSDRYMAGQVMGLYQKITVATGFAVKLRRIHEAVVFHEFRHFVVRILVRLGLF